ncbi:MAG: alpha/beta fold hydrolase [Candidatus Lokiarchaeota archaeon]|nr:alpha/beta fold hydrolase [Candidatus Lokiarchaeota archaeon]
MNRKKIELLFLIMAITGSIISGVVLLLYNSASFKTEEFHFYPSEVTDWQIADESFQLHGEVYYPRHFMSSEAYPTVILFHGLSRTLQDHSYLIDRLVRLGLLCYAIDFRGHGSSDGEYPGTSETRNTTFGDSFGIYRYIQEFPYVDKNKLISFGISMGGANALLLAVENLVPYYVLSFPAVGYYWNADPLYNYTITGERSDGLVMAGTADSCGACIPEYVNTFSNNNPGSEIHWFEGATHTDSDFWLESMQLTELWIKNKLNLAATTFLNNKYIIIGLSSVSFIMAGFLTFICWKRMRNPIKNITHTDITENND